MIIPSVHLCANCPALARLDTAIARLDPAVARLDPAIARLALGLVVHEVTPGAVGAGSWGGFTVAFKPEKLMKTSKPCL